MTLKAIDINLKKYPAMNLTQHDWMALAMQESRFNEKCLGSVKEQGIFQVRPEYYHGRGLADPFINTALAFKIMYSKFKEHHGDKRKAIVGYNGFIVRNGKLIDRYYLAVMKQKKRIQEV